MIQTDHISKRLSQVMENMKEDEQLRCAALLGHHIINLISLLI